MKDPFGLTGTTIEGDVRVDTVVGEGGFGVVYRGWHGAFDVPVAIKLLKLPRSFEGEQRDVFLKKFHLEAKILYKLSQATLNVVRAISFGSVDTEQGLAPFCVLEWLDGRTLEAQMLDRRRLIDTGQLTAGRSIDSISELVDPLVEALSEAHDLGVVHRDIKPTNVFLASGTGGPRVKLLDFGIAKLVDMSGEISGGTTLSKGTLLALTPEYAAPEQWDRSIGEVSPRTDLYSLALLAVELLLDRRASEGLTPSQCMFAALNPEARPTPRRFGAGVPDALEAEFARALAVEPGQRPATVRQWWSDVRAAAGSAMTVPVAVDPAAPATGPGLPATVAAPVDPGRTLPPEATKPGAPVHQPPRRPLRSGLIGLGIGVGVAALASVGIYAIWTSSNPDPGRATVVTKKRKKTTIVTTAGHEGPSLRQRLRAAMDQQRWSDALALCDRVPDKDDETGAACQDARDEQMYQSVVEQAINDAIAGRDQKAVAAFKTIPRKSAPARRLARHPGFIAARNRWREKRRATRPPGSPLQQLLKAARRAQRKGNHRRALKLGRKALELAPRNGQALEIVGTAACHLRKDEVIYRIMLRAPADMRRRLQRACSDAGFHVNIR